MKFVLTAGWEDGIADLTERLVKELAANKKVLWLTSGGSNIPASVQILDNIPSKLAVNLTVLLADERYGSVGHQNSNWEQLMQAGFEVSKANCLPIIEDNLPLDQTTSKYRNLVERAFQDNDEVIAQLGVGPDGHIAGLLLGSEAIESNDQYVTSYTSSETPPLVRMTLTFDALRKVNAAYCFAFGQPKHDALVRLQKTRTSIKEQPAQILKELPECYLYNDQVGHHGR